MPLTRSEKNERRGGTLFPAWLMYGGLGRAFPGHHQRSGILENGLKSISTIMVKELQYSTIGASRYEDEYILGRGSFNKSHLHLPLNSPSKAFKMRSVERCSEKATPMNVPRASLPKLVMRLTAGLQAEAWYRPKG